MTEEAAPTTPKRNRPGPKPGKKAAPPNISPTRGVSMNPLPDGNLLVKIEMEVPLIMAIELANAVAVVQAKLAGDPHPRAQSPFPTAVAPSQAKTRWVSPPGAPSTNGADASPP